MTTLASLVARIGTLLLCIALAMGAAGAQDSAPENPIPRIEAGMHVVPVSRMDVDKSCRLIITGSKDKTARLWELPESGAGEAKLRYTLRVPIGNEDNEGKVFAVAISPDGKIAAAGGWDVLPDRDSNHAIYIFDTATGEIIQRLPGQGSVIEQLVFSHDNRYLVGTISSKHGLRIWDTQSWHIVAEDKDYGDEIFGASFDDAGQLYTVSYDHYLRKYGPDFKLKKKVKVSGGKHPFTVAIHPRGDRIAVGLDDTPRVEVYRTADLRRMFTADASGMNNGDLNSVSWTSDGTELFAAGRWSSNGRTLVRIWGQEGRGKGRDAELALGTIHELLPCGRNVAVGAADPAFGLIDAFGEKRLWQDSPAADMRNKLGRNFTVSADGSKVRFGLGMGIERPVLFDASASILSDAQAGRDDLFPPDTTSLNVTGWNNTPSMSVAKEPLKLNGKPLPILVGSLNLPRSLAIAPDGSFVAGQEWRIEAFNRQGQLIWRRPAPAGVVWGVNVPKNGKFVVAAYGDGSIRWHNLSDGRELLALFVNAKDREWVLWSPEGYYNSSPGGAKYIGWHLNRGVTKAAGFVTGAQMRQQFYRPDVIAGIFKLANNEEAIRLAGPASVELNELSHRHPPEFSVISPEDNSPVDADVVDVGLRIALNRDPITSFRVTVNGVDVTAADGRDIKQPKPDSYTISLPVPLREGTNAISITAANVLGETTRKIILSHAGQGPLNKKGRLFILAVGVNKYANFSPKSQLNFAVADAIGVNTVLAEKAGSLHSEVVSTLLVSGAPPVLDDRQNSAAPLRTNIEAALARLKKEARPEDTVVVFLAGHGANQGRDYLFLPEEARSNGNSWLPQSVVKWQSFQEALANTNGRRILFVDTCHSAGAFNARLVNDAVAADIIVFSATDRATEAQELPDLNHGVFSYALIEGLRGRADPYQTGEVHILALGTFVSTEVQRATNKVQQPTFSLTEAKDFVVAVP